MTKPIILVFLGAAAIAGLTCTREDGQPDPPQQVLVPCDPTAPGGDPSACPPDAGVDAAIDASMVRVQSISVGR
jgi:hypothetical protein